MFKTVIEEFFQAAEEVRKAQEEYDNAKPEVFDVVTNNLNCAKRQFEITQNKVKMFGT